MIKSKLIFGWILSAGLIQAMHRNMSFFFLTVLFAIGTPVSSNAQRALKNQSNISEDDIALSMEIHNKARQEVGTPPLIWSVELANEAQDYADRLANINGRLIHSASRYDQGENLYKTWSSSQSLNNIPSHPGRDATLSWYDEIKAYRYSKIRRFRIGPKIGHYTQMIWKSTTHIGIGWAVSRTGALYVVARYSPAGNYIREYPY